jgi:hypothetical protein
MIFMLVLQPLSPQYNIPGYPKVSWITPNDSYIALIPN